GTGWYRGYAVSKHIIDIPNNRSAHCVPTPRGGGIIFVGCFLLIMFYYYPLHFIILPISALGVAILGYWDDKYSLSAKKRLLSHFFLSTLAVIILSPLPPISIGAWIIPSSIWLTLLGVLFLVWMLNLYNFMDGINGIAGSEAICVALGLAMIYWVTGHLDVMYLPLLLAAAVMGFLVWNFPKARLFMGDVGSGFLGFIFGIWSLQSLYFDAHLFWSCLILLGVFIVDATTTLLIRMLRKQPLHKAHSQHAYQHATRRYASHNPVTIAVIVCNVFWLWPFAFLVGLHYLDGFIGLCMAYIPLIFLAFFFKAGYD
ncbi:MAG TPA: glycosyltransferase family 4 protein, partial [Legionellaceae bacterium]|nr:glycosyltransferase family 4 protein [Legionellaceae bacterium]